MTRLEDPPLDATAATFQRDLAQLAKEPFAETDTSVRLVHKEILELASDVQWRISHIGRAVLARWNS